MATPALIVESTLRFLREHVPFSEMARKDLEFKRSKSWRERLSLATSRSTLAAEAQLCGQLYAIRAEIARQQVRRNRAIMPTVSGSNMAFRTATGVDTCLLHQASYPFA